MTLNVSVFTGSIADTLGDQLEVGVLRSLIGIDVSRDSTQCSSFCSSGTGLGDVSCFDSSSLGRFSLRTAGC